MTTYLIRRLLLMFPTLLGVSIVVFAVFAMAPGGISGAILSQDSQLTPGAQKYRTDYLQRRYGLNSPPYIQYLRWLNKLSPVGMKQDPEKGNFTGFGFKDPELGDSFVRTRKVTNLIADALPNTLTLSLLSIPVTYVIAVLSGLLAARFRGGTFDVASGAFFLGMFSFPIIAACVLCIGYLSSVEYLPIFPSQGLHSLGSGTMRFLPSIGANGSFASGYFVDMVWHLVLPVICLSYASFAFLAKLSRSSVLEVVKADFVRTARAKGLGERVVMLRHVFRNSLLPMITFLSSLLPSLVTGAVVVESAFGIDGMGRLFVQAVQQRDVELALGITMITSFLTVVSYLLADILYVVADPRVSFD